VLAPLIAPLSESLQQRCIAAPGLLARETPIRYLDPGNGKTGQGYLWVVHRPGADVLFEWYTTREAKCLDQLITRHFNGTIQCDGYSAYDRFAKYRAIEGQPVLLAGCWAHARRGFYDALDHAPKEAAWVLDPTHSPWKEELVIFGDADAGQRSAIIYSIIESCRRHGIEPYTYLRDVLTRLPTMTNRQIKDIVPKAWAAAARNTVPRAA
jgi:hypothetical protein